MTSGEDSASSTQESWLKAFGQELSFGQELLLGLSLVMALLVSGCTKESSVADLPGIAQSQAIKATSNKLAALDLAGREVDPFDTAETNATVFIFVATECPISNRYAPEMRRLQQKFAGAGIRFWLVYADPETSPAAIQEHLRAYSLRFDVLRDPKHDLVRMSQVRVTPEAAVFLSGRRLVYHGRIDDRYVDSGKERLQVTHHELEQVIEAIVDGQPVPQATVRAVGCYISDIK